MQRKDQRQVNVVEVLEGAHRDVATVVGGISVALARRNIRRGSVSYWNRLLREAQERLTKLEAVG